MSRLLFIEVRAQARLIFLMSVITLIGALFLRDPLFAYFLAGFGTMALHFLAKRSHWYHQLPYSRKKIASLLLLQSLLSFVLLLALSILQHFVVAKILGRPFLFASIPLLATACAGALVFPLIAPLSGVPKARNQYTEIKFDKRFFKSLAIVAIGFAVFALASWKSERLTLVGIYATAPLCVLLSFSTQFVFAPNTHKFLKHFCLVGFAVILASLFACYLAA